MATKTKMLYTRTPTSTFPLPPTIGQRVGNMFEGIWGTSGPKVIPTGSTNVSYVKKVIDPIEQMPHISSLKEMMVLEPTSAIASGSGRGYDFDILDASKKYTIGCGFIQNRNNVFYLGFANSSGTGTYTASSSALAVNTPRYYVYKRIPPSQSELYPNESGSFSTTFSRLNTTNPGTVAGLTRIRMLLGYTANEGTERWDTTVGMFFRPFCFEGETWFEFSNIPWKSGLFTFGCEVEYNDATNLITKVGEIKQLGYSAKGKDFISICEPLRSGLTSAKFGGALGKYKLGGEDLYNRFASYPSGFGYAKYASNLDSNLFKYNGIGTNIPSAQGCRPNSYTSVKISLTTVGTWYLWRDLNDKSIKLANSSGEIVGSYSASSFGLTEPPEILIVRAVGGGGGGGGGDSFSQGATGGSGGGAGIAWIEVPIANTSNYSSMALKCVVGGGGSGAGRNSGSRGGTGGTTYIDNGGTRMFTATGGGGGIVKNPSGPPGTWSGVNTFASSSGGGGGGPGGSASVSSFSISPETLVGGWSQAGGAKPGLGGGGGASLYGTGGKGGANGSAPNSGSGYGSGGGGGTFIFHLFGDGGQAGSAGRAGMIMFSY